ncbi:MAG: hypothetical protein QOE05_3817 [Actinomycetota bacterium]|jgi:hypothetical protein|nr:hypothetical protein [Actinomycetota bacterium]
MPVLTQRAAARFVLAAATAGAGAIHLAFAPEHLAEYRPLGIGFVAAGGLQLLWAALVTVRDSPRWLYAGGVLSLVFVGVYLLSRTVGLPLGPEAFEPEAFGTSDLMCCALEVPVGLAAIALARRPAALRRRLGVRWAAAVAASFVLVGSASTTALAASGSHDHEHGDVHEHSCPAAPVRTGVADERGVDTGVTAYFACLLEHEHDHSHA